MSKGRFKAVMFALGLSVPGAALAGGGVVCSVAEPVWRAGHSQAETTIIQGVDQMAASVARESQITTEQVISAIRVATRQRALNSTREAEFQRASAKGVAQAFASQRAAEQVRRAHETYGPAGQAVGACEAVAQIQRVGSAFGSVQDRASEILSGGAIFGGPGEARSAGQAAGQVLAQDQPEAVSAEAFLDPETPPELRDAFMNNVIGLPLEKPQGNERVSDRLELVQDRRIEAVRAPARLSLAVIRAASDDGGHFDTDEGAETLSSMSAADWLISQYGGGREYEEWSAALVTKSHVGLLKEAARLRAIQLMLNNVRQGSADRRQVIISALIGAEAVR